MTKRYWQTSDFWKDAGEKIVTSFFQGTIALLIINGFSDWKNAILAGGIVSAISAVKSLIGSQVAPNSTTPTSII